MEKLKNRLDAFSDAIIAIIITIMVLNIPPVMHDSWANYLQLGKAVGIFLVSFIFVANMWYQHGTAFSEIETMTYRILILDMAFLALLALMPLFTNMMALHTTRVSVILYGGLQVAVNFLFRYLAKAIVHLQYTEKSEMQKVYTKIYGTANRYLDLMSLAMLVVAFFLPDFAVIFYLAYPILMFLLNSQARQQMYDVATLPSDQQADFVSLTADGVRDFRKAWREASGRTSGSLPGRQPRTTGGQEPGRGSRATTAAHETPVEKRRADGGDADVFNLHQWLDTSVDPRWRHQVERRFDHMSPTEQAQFEQKMGKWFELQKAAREQRLQASKDEQKPRE
ncbi:TMEM175 family protein [Lacticaseibacillus mingshuiensis]|uniref:TMEM175 family protein n=1 Tax=Lacticaseibacillus mingshuiensis TaxID=2799574 RepID=A0ABW4CKR8_9LACO|nr:TMEM175 family protein [Lacticaseibacillus mingshuiensis]